MVLMSYSRFGADDLRRNSRHTRLSIDMSDGIRGYIFREEESGFVSPGIGTRLRCGLTELKRNMFRCSPLGSEDARGSASLRRSSYLLAWETRPSQAGVELDRLRYGRSPGFDYGTNVASASRLLSVPATRGERCERHARHHPPPVFVQ